MLEYFDRHGQETNAAYQCAAVLAGTLAELLGDDAYDKWSN